MLILISIILVIASFLMICARKNDESFLLFGMCISLAMEICGVMIFIAKKGGISQDVMMFFYFTRKIHTRIQYLGITLNQLGYLIAIGRILFPFFFLRMAIRYSMVVWVRKYQWIKHGIGILPAVSLVIYYPVIYRNVTEKNLVLQNTIMEISTIWITVYLIAAILLLVIEYFSLSMKFSKRQFGQITMSMIAMAFLYILYYRQDPGQVYRFYSQDFVWNRGIGYLQINPSLMSYIWLVGVTIVCMITGFFGLFQYTSEVYEEKREEMVMQRKFNMAKVGASMFVHGMKNQLLASKVVYKRIWQVCEQPEIDIDKLKEYISSLEGLNNAMLDRVEDLYRSVKSNAITLSPVEASKICSETVERFHKKYPEKNVEISCPEDIYVLADYSQLCEALCNILMNAQDAVSVADREAEKVGIQCYNERNYTVMVISDNGNGMTKKQMKKVFEPFYTSKNSNYNWGMGLYYAREVVKGHLGFIKVESKLGVGTQFFIMLPRYH